ncbi:MAG: hypothetical protein AB3X44_07095 [Leptothrix sp. (in: b-proteobacteria)]
MNTHASTTLMQLLPQWHELTSRLLPLCTPDALDLASLPAADVERLRQSAETLSLVIWSWQITHRDTSGHHHTGGAA